MHIEKVSIESLIPYDRNNILHVEEQINLIANSISKYGWTVPILVQRDNIVIAGHGRLLAAKKLGLTEVPVVRAERMSEAEAREYRILDNALACQSEWDYENLQVEFDVLRDGGFDFAGWGLNNLIPSYNAVEPKEYTEDIAAGVALDASFKIKIPVDDSAHFETRLDELLREFPTATKQKSL